MNMRVYILPIQNKSKKEEEIHLCWLPVGTEDREMDVRSVPGSRSGGAMNVEACCVVRWVLVVLLTWRLHRAALRGRGWRLYTVVDSSSVETVSIPRTRLFICQDFHQNGILLCRFASKRDFVFATKLTQICTTSNKKYQVQTCYNCSEDLHQKGGNMQIGRAHV